MKWIIGIVAVLALLVAVPLGVGGLLPIDHRATVAASVDAPPDLVWRAITTVEDYARWRSDVDSVRLLDKAPGAVSWVEIGPTGRLPMTQQAAEPPTRLVVRVLDEGLPFGGTWTYELSGRDGGTRIEITEDGEVRNRFFRFVSRFVIGHEAALRRYLGDLTRDLGGEVET